MKPEKNRLQILLEAIEAKQLPDSWKPLNALEKFFVCFITSSTELLNELKLELKQPYSRLEEILFRILEHKDLTDLGPPLNRLEELLFCLTSGKEIPEIAPDKVSLLEILLIAAYKAWSGQQDGGNTPDPEPDPDPTPDPEPDPDPDIPDSDLTDDIIEPGHENAVQILRFTGERWGKISDPTFTTEPIVLEWASMAEQV